MQKANNFSSSLAVLEKSDKKTASSDVIYRMGVIGQFNLTFELAWKALQAELYSQGVAVDTIASPRQIIKSSFKIGLVKNESIWLKMLSDRNTSVHIYDENKADILIKNIFELYIKEFNELNNTLNQFKL